MKWSSEQVVLYNAINKIKNMVVFEDIFDSSDERFLMQHLDVSREDFEKIVGDLRLNVLFLLRELGDKYLSTDAQGGGIFTQE